MPDAEDRVMHAIHLYARAWNTLDFSQFFKVLDGNCRYVSQFMFEDVVGRETVVTYLNRTLETILFTENTVRAEIAQLERGTNSFPADTPCVVVRQGKNRESAMIVFLTVENQCVTQIEIGIPELYTVNVLDKESLEQIV